jgi:hypothetical protein
MFAHIKGSWCLLQARNKLALNPAARASEQILTMISCIAPGTDEPSLQESMCGSTTSPPGNYIDSEGKGRRLFRYVYKTV